MTMAIPYEFDDAEVCHASVNLDTEWRSCCLRAMGYYHHDDPAGSGYVNNPEGILTAPRSATPHTVVKIVNLIPDSAYRKDKQRRAERKNSKLDPWMEAAIQVNASILRTRDWIAHKQHEYASVVMSSNEASLIESTVASFVATTATEIESLRQMVSGQASAAHSTTAAGGGGGRGNKLHHRFHQQELEHRSGIVQILMLDLQQKVSMPFQLLQKKRKRLAVHVWQNPFECTLYTTGPTAAESGLNDNDDDEGDDDPRHRHHDPRLQFLPRRPAHRLQANLWESYHPSANPKKRPRRPPTALLRRLDNAAHQGAAGNDEPSGDRSGGAEEGAPGTIEAQQAAATSSSSSSWFSSHKRAKNSASSEAASAALPKTEPKLRRRRNQPPPASSSAAWGKATYVNASAVPLNDDGDGGTSTNYYESHRDVLEREAAQLELVANSDLDAVQQMERHMVDITALLSQFANLVSDQAADVSHIYHATNDAKDNVDQGQQNLLEARERTEASRHYLATAIAVLGVLLLAFHWIRP
jgi:hypothetical protein